MQKYEKFDVDILYEDNFCKLTEKTLTIKWYYFPTAKDKVIPLTEIKKLYYKEQVACGDLFKVKGWGMSFTPCWWACDLLRDRFNIVVEVDGSSILCGFSVIDIKNFLDNVKSVARFSVNHGFPF